MHRLGLKLFSNDLDHIDSARNLYDKGAYNYIELYAVPGSFDFIQRWHSLKIPFIIHAPHFKHGLNLSKVEHLTSNMRLLEQTKQWADVLNAEIIIIHPGMDGNINETVRQLKQIADARCIVENKTYEGLNKTSVAIGYEAKQIEFITKSVGIGFCFDISHCIAAAYSLKRDAMSSVKEFVALHPRMYHFADGLINDTKDKHWHLGEGDYPLKEISLLIPPDSMITIETRKDDATELIEFAKDLKFMANLF